MRLLRCGQAVSSRPDVVPPLYLRELEKLQDQIPPFPNDDAFAVIQLELGQPPAGLFSELGATTIAAASLGQVRAAVSASLDHVVRRSRVLVSVS